MDYRDERAKVIAEFCQDNFGNQKQFLAMERLVALIDQFEDDWNAKTMRMTTLTVEESANRLDVATRIAAGYLASFSDPLAQKPNPGTVVRYAMACADELITAERRSRLGGLP